MFLPHFDVICDQLLNSTVETICLFTLKKHKNVNNVCLLLTRPQSSLIFLLKILIRDAGAGGDGKAKLVSPS